MGNVERLTGEQWEEDEEKTEAATAMELVFAEMLMGSEMLVVVEAEMRVEVAMAMNLDLAAKSEV